MAEEKVFLKVLDRRNTGEPMMSCEEALISIGPINHGSKHKNYTRTFLFMPVDNGWGCVCLNKRSGLKFVPEQTGHRASGAYTQFNVYDVLRMYEVASWHGLALLMRICT